MRGSLAVAPLFAQGLKFGVVGGLATAVHLVLFVLCIELAGMAPFWANLPAFAVAVLVGFLGHFLWTFRRRDGGGTGLWWGALGKFAVTAALGLAMNSLIVYAVVDVSGFAYGYAALLMATATPAAVFVISKFWAFA